MAEYRTIQTKLWRDEWYSGLDCESRLLWVYLITNDAASVAGIYRLAERYITFETGIDQKRVREIMRAFKAAGRIDFEGDVIWIKKMREYQESRSPKVQARIIKDVRAIPACRVKSAYCKKYGIGAASAELYRIDTVSIPDRTDTDTDTETDTDTDTDTDTLPAADAAPALAPAVEPVVEKTKRVRKATTVPEELLLTSITHGAELQSALTAHFSGLARPVPAWIAFASTTQRDAFQAAADALDGEFVKLATTGLSRNISQREKLLAWLEGCVRRKHAAPARTQQRADPRYMSVSDKLALIDSWAADDAANGAN